MAVDVIGADSFPNDFFTIVRYGEYPLDILMALADAQPSDFQVTEDVYIDGTLYMEAFSACESVEQAQTLLTAIQEGRAQSPGVLCHIVDPANTMLALAEPFVFVGNDGYVDRIEATGELDGHPRAAGTFSRFLGHWARDNGVMNLMQALYKATAAPAIWFGLETKGRIQAGADADLVVFDPEGIIDMANTDDKSHFLEPPSGIDYVVVAGSVVVDHGRLTGSTPGKVIRRTWAVPGLHGWQLGD
jgi:N-acyl-D-aspartate/D-glutamate deacylase